MKSLRTALLASALACPFMPVAASAALVDGGYTISGFSYGTTITLSGTFDIVGGAVDNLLIELDFPSFPFGNNAVYSGPGANLPIGTMFTGETTLSNPGSFGTGIGFLNLASDGTWLCGGRTLSASSYGCEVKDVVLGTLPSEVSGTYTLARITPAVVPLPAAGMLLAGGLGTFAALGRRRA